MVWQKLCKWMKALPLASAFAGLCALAQANTTIPASPVVLAQNDITITAETAAPAVGSNPFMSGASGAPLTAFGSGAVRIALLLPLNSTALRPAAEMVRAGFMAANERERDAGLRINVVQTGDTAADILNGYQTALRDSDIVVGPLSRSGVTALAQSGAVAKPTIALTQADVAGEVEPLLPPGMLVIGLSVEQEARQVADMAAESHARGKALVVSTATAWQRRAARAFAAQWQHGGPGMAIETLEIGLTGGYLNVNTLVQLKKRLQADKPDLLFVALDAGQARQLREAIGAEVPMFGTSQLNPLTMQEWVIAERVPAMNGVRLVDLPWQLQVDHPAVMAYPRLPAAPDQHRSADLERLYALGIDAFRVAHEIAQNHTLFEIDGVTGRLKIDYGRGPARFERLESPAIYRDGAVAPLEDGQ